jgi:hypothetical protein
MKKLVVCFPNRMIFEVNRTTLDPLRTSSYDAYCFSDPRPDVEYMSSDVWYRERAERRTVSMRLSG